jgi:hypothetical protein
MDFLLNDNKVVEFTVKSFKNASLMLFNIWIFMLKYKRVLKK